MEQKISFDKISSNELDVLKLFWVIEKPITARYINDHYDKWRDKKYLFRVINSLVKKGFLISTGEILVSGKLARVYTFSVSQEEYETFCFESISQSSAQKLFSRMIKTSAETNHDEIINYLYAMIDELEEKP